MQYMTMSMANDNQDNNTVNPPVTRAFIQDLEDDTAPAPVYGGCKPVFYALPT